MPDQPYAMGVDIGVTNTKLVIADADGRVSARDSIPTDADAAGWPANIAAAIGRIEKSRGPARWLGVAAPGLARPDGACIDWMQGRLDRVQGLNWTAYLNRPQSVPALNDAQAALLGEVWQGAAAGARNAMLLTLGTGVGGALMVDGHVLRGHIGRAGHLGHVCLNPDGEPDVTGVPGSLEDAIGNCTLFRRSNGRFSSTHELVAAHLAGDADASTVWLTSVKALACGAASLINVADPEVVIIGGGIARCGAALFEPLAQILDKIEWRPHGRRARITPAALGEHAGALGAAYNAILVDKGNQ